MCLNAETTTGPPMANGKCTTPSSHFVSFINDICRAVPKATVKLYADDTNVFLFDKIFKILTLKQTCVYRN